MTTDDLFKLLAECRTTVERDEESQLWRATMTDPDGWVHTGTSPHSSSDAVLDLGRRHMVRALVERRKARARPLTLTAEELLDFVGRAKVTLAYDEEAQGWRASMTRWGARHEGTDVFSPVTALLRLAAVPDVHADITREKVRAELVRAQGAGLKVFYTPSEFGGDPEFDPARLGVMVETTRSETA